MKVTLTKTELLKILSDRFNTMIDDVVISKAQYAIGDRITEALSKAISVNPSHFRNGFASEHKIPAIKALREINKGMGLGDSKWAIENWQQWITFVKEKGRIPKITPHDSSWSDVKLL